MTPDQSIDCNHSSAEDAQDALESSVTKLLRHLPERWAEFSPDDLSAQETTALALLIAAEMVERRCRFRLRMLNQPLAVEATITATGEYGLAEALESLSARLWEEWRGAFAAWRASDVRDATPVHGELLEPQELRLTTSGVQARCDLIEGRRRMVFDFVLRRWPLTFRPPVRGQGRLLRFGPPDAKVPSASVAVANWNEGAAAFAEAFSRLAESLQSQGQSPSAVSATPTPKTATRCEGRNLDTEARLKRFLSDRAARYEQLVEAVLRGETDARREFQEQFGPTAFARHVVQETGGGDEEFQRIKTAVQQSPTYKQRIKPILSGRPPKDWRNAESRDVGVSDQDVDDFVDTMRRQARGA